VADIRISDQDIIDAIDPEFKRCADWAGQLSDERERCDSLYNRLPYGNEEDGKSSYVAATVFDTVNWILPGMVDIFTHPDFFTVNMDDAEKAEKVRRLVRYQMFKKQKGAKEIRNYVQTALKYHNSVVKVFYDDDFTYETEAFDGPISAEEFSQLESDPLVEITKYEEVEESNELGSIVYYQNVKIVRSISEYQGPKLLCVPPYEFFISAGALDIDSAQMVVHRQRKTLNDIKLGEVSGIYKKGSTKRAEEMAIVEPSDAPELQEERERIYDVDGLEPLDVALGGAVDMENKHVKPNKEVYVDEVYTKLDIDNDGMLENVIVWRSGDVVLNVIENPYGRPPFRSGCMLEVPFRMEGKPLPLIIEQDQKEMTNLRRIYTNATAENAYGTMVSDDDQFLDDWAERTVGDSIKIQRGSFMDSIRPDQPGEALIKSIEIVRSDYERTTGVNSLNQGLTADSMGKTATGTVALQNAGQQRQALYATILGEALKDVIADFIWINKTWPPEGETQILGAQALTISPDDLDGDADVSIEVGVGPNERFAKIQRLEGHFQKLAKVLIPSGMAGPEHLNKTEQRIAKLSNVNVDDLQYSEDEILQKQQQMQQQQMQQQQMMQQPVPPQTGGQPIG